MSDNQENSLLKKINHHLSKSRLTKKEFARLIEVSEVTVQSILNGKQSIKVETLQKIAKALEVDIKEFFKNDVDIELEEMLSKERKDLLVFKNMFKFLQHMYIVDIDAVAPKIQSVIRNKSSLATGQPSNTYEVKIVRNIDFYDLIEYFSAFKNYQDAIVSLYPYVNNEKFDRSYLIGIFGSEYEEWLLNYTNNIKKK